MKTEVIIAVRGELPQNLKRTVESIGDSAQVCIVQDGAETAPVAGDVAARVLRPWQTPRGPGAARHFGIVSSDADLILLCDGHMQFPMGAMQAIEKFHAKRKGHLTCCRMQSMDQAGAPMDAQLEGGAWLCLKSREVCDEYWPLSAKWNDPPRSHGSIGAVMGACYAFRRSWYERIGQPLQVLQAWGGDEEILSVSTLLMGGTVYLLNVPVGHIYAAAYQGRQTSVEEVGRRWANRRAVLESIPMPDAERADLLAWMSQTRRIVNTDVVPVPAACAAVRDVLSRGKRTWPQLKAAGIVREPTENEQARFLGSRRRRDDDVRQRNALPPAPRGDVAQIVTRPAEVCKLCGAENPFRQVRGTRRLDAIGVAYARCFRCGHKAQIRRMLA